MAKAKKVAIVETKESAEALLKKKIDEETTITVIDNATEWFNRLSGDDNLRHAAMTTCQLIRDTVGIVYIDSMWPLIPMIYDAVYESLIEHIGNKRGLHKKYKITVGRNFVMSYDNIDTDQAEQEGCFMPMMDHAGTCIRLSGKINSSKKVTFATIDNMYGENYTSNSDIEHIKAIASNKLQKMYSTDKDGKILASDKSQIYLPPNLIMVIFSLFHDCILARLKMMKEANPDDDVEINVLGLYVVAIEDVESPDANYEGYYIHYAPKDIVKLALKSDALASKE